MTSHCHEAIAKLAKEMANEVFEMWLYNNDFYEASAGVDRDAWVERTWPDYVEAARETMAQLLGTNQINEEQKALIYDVLLKDNILKIGRANARRKGMH